MRAVLVRFAPARRRRVAGRMSSRAQFVSNGAGVSLLYAREPYFIAACLGLVHELSVSVRLTQYAVVIAWLSLVMKYAAPLTPTHLRSLTALRLAAARRASFSTGRRSSGWAACAAARARSGARRRGTRSF